MWKTKQINRTMLSIVDRSEIADASRGFLLWLFRFFFARMIAKFVEVVIA